MVYVTPVKFRAPAGATFKVLVQKKKNEYWTKRITVDGNMNVVADLNGFSKWPIFVGGLVGVGIGVAIVQQTQTGSPDQKWPKPPGRP